MELDPAPLSGMLAGPSTAASSGQAAALEVATDAALAAADEPRADAAERDAMDAIQLHDPEAEKQLQQLLMGSSGAGDFPAVDMDSGSESEAAGRSLTSPAGSRAMLKSRLWEQQVGPVTRKAILNKSYHEATWLFVSSYHELCRDF